MAVDRTCEMTERMAALGKMSASLAHELKNPATAAQRAAAGLREAYEHIKKGALEYDCRFDDAEREVMRPLLQETLERRRHLALQKPLERDELEERLSRWLESHGVDDPNMAPELLDAGAPVESLLKLDSQMRPESVTAALLWVKKLLHVQALVDDVEQSTARIADVAKAIGSFSRPEGDTMQETDIQATLETTLSLLSFRLKGGVKVVRDYAAALPKVSAYGGRLTQVWTNLMGNALDAMPNGGTLTVGTALLGGKVRVTIGDTGSGIPPEIQARVFEPFFTTKASAGTGLGLDISHRIIEDHGGHCEFESNSRGTTFHVTLPLHN